MAEVGMPHHLQPLHPIQPQHLPPMDPPLCTCGDLATFAMTGSCRPTHCMAHREPGMMEVKKCVCGKARPSYALPGVSEATHCASKCGFTGTFFAASDDRCKTDDMINVGSTPRKCFCGRAQPNFAHRGQQKPTHCAKCKEPGMVNIRASTCQCGKAVPSFGVPGAPKATHCMACKEEGMVNVVSRKCHCGRAVPNFGAAGQKKRTHCAQCKEPGMVNLSKNPAARQPLPQIPVPPPMMMAPQDPMMGLHPHQINMGQQIHLR
ncbi:MAG: hypothetical protein FRX49_07370 [Trebouxia sp. A1-2]|nr:MAG: hypothetical protein FRX49_07370 [Trebouxia sp. A1-2]